MMILRSIMQYDVDHSTWKIPHSQEDMSRVKSDVLKLANNNAYEEYEKFIRTFDAHLRKDENIILIMSAIVLFTPDRAKTVHTDVIILEQVLLCQTPFTDIPISIANLSFTFPEFLLLFIKTIRGEYLSGLWSKITIFKINS